MKKTPTNLTSINVRSLQKLEIVLQLFCITMTDPIRIKWNEINQIKDF